MCASHQYVEIRLHDTMMHMVWALNGITHGVDGRSWMHRNLHGLKASTTFPPIIHSTVWRYFIVDDYDADEYQ